MTPIKDRPGWYKWGKKIVSPAGRLLDTIGGAFKGQLPKTQFNKLKEEAEANEFSSSFVNELKEKSELAVQEKKQKWEKLNRVVEDKESKQRRLDAVSKQIDEVKEKSVTKPAPEPNDKVVTIILNHKNEPVVRINKYTFS